MTGVTTRALTGDQWPEWRTLRRAALATDPDAFGSTLADWSGPGDIEDRWRARLNALALNIVADLDGQAVGMVSASLPIDGTVEVISMWVAPAARGRGVGDALMETALSWARQRGAIRVALDVRQANAAAIALYRRHGFRHAGWASSPDDHIPELRMVLELG